MSARKLKKTGARIMHAAEVLYEERGVDGATFEEIAARAGVCRTTVFNHFSCAEELHAALAAREIDEVIEHCACSCETGIPAIERLLDKLIDDTVAYPRIMTRLTNTCILSPNGARVARIERLIAENLAAAFCGAERVPLGCERMSQMVLGLYYGQVNHRHVHALPFLADDMKPEMRVLLRHLLGREE